MKLLTYIASVPGSAVPSIPKVALGQTQLDSAVNGAFMIAGVIAVLFIIIAGFRYVTSQGNSDAIRSAREMIIYSVVGLVIVIMAFAIVQIVIRVVNIK